MKSDLTDAQARAEAGSRVASNLEYVNPHKLFTGTLRDGLWFLTPSVHQLYALEIASGDNPRAHVYTSSDKWILRSLGYGYNPNSGRYESLIAELEEVTTGGNYGIVVTQIVDVNDLGYPTLPAVGAGLQAFDPLANYPVDDPDYELPGYGSGLQEPGQPDQPAIGCDQFNVSMKTGEPVVTHNNSTFGETYLVQAEGDAVVIETDTEWYAYFDFSQGQLGWTKVNGTTYPCHYTASDGWYSEYGSDQGGNEIRIHLEFDDTVITQCTVFYDRDAGGGVEGGYVRVLYGSVTQEEYTNLGISSGTNQNYTQSFTDGDTVDEFETNCAFTDLTGDERVRCSGITLRGTGTAPTQISGNATTFIASSGDIRGDAFYYDYQDGDAPTLYGGGHGLRVDGSPPSTIPPYDSSHRYLFAVTGTGSTLGFDFEDADLSDNSNNKLLITVCGDNMALTAL